MPNEVERNRAARDAAEHALVRVVHHYGSRPEFVILGGLVPDLLCSGSPVPHAGTSDVDVQVNLEIALGAVNAHRLESALHAAAFTPDAERTWRWATPGPRSLGVVKFELLADLDDVPAEAVVGFDGCQRLGAVNLRGTGFASRDTEVRELRATSHEGRAFGVKVTGLAGFLMAKSAAARSRRTAKDWYDIAYVLQHNDAGGPEAAAEAVRRRFPDEIKAHRSTLEDLRANFADPDAQGPRAYASQMEVDDPTLDPATAAADAVLAVETFHQLLYPSRSAAQAR